MKNQKINKPYSEADLQQFDFHGTPIRILKDEDNKPWFLASDVCTALGLSNASVAIKAIDREETRTNKVYFRSVDGISQQRSVLMISESGLYALAFRSRKPEAKPFQKWITATVIPSIREHGGYVKGQESIPEEYRRWMHNHIQNNLMPALRRVDDLTHYSGFKPKHKQEQEKAAAISSVAERYNLPHELVDDLATKGLYVVKDKVDKLA